jgi:tRNA/rRNA methyltransferase
MADVTWILHQTSHPGNVGSAARAIKTMGFAKLVLAKPLQNDVIESEEAIALSSGAHDVLSQAKIYPSLREASHSYPLVFGLSARDREFGPPCISLKEATKLAKGAVQQNQDCAFLFGTERTGLSNEDFEYCSHRVFIDANPSYSSLNLAQAVMICAYEMRQELFIEEHPPTEQVERASLGSINAMMEHLREGLESVEFLDPNHPKKLMERLRALFDRAGLQPEEVDILRGIAKQMIAASKRI